MKKHNQNIAQLAANKLNSKKEVVLDSSKYHNQPINIRPTKNNIDNINSGNHKQDDDLYDPKYCRNDSFLHLENMFKQFFLNFNEENHNKKIEETKKEIERISDEIRKVELDFENMVIDETFGGFEERVFSGIILSLSYSRILKYNELDRLMYTKGVYHNSKHQYIK